MSKRSLGFACLFLITIFLLGFLAFIQEVSGGGTVTVIGARIDSYSPSTKITVNKGESFKLEVWFTNTGSSGAYFYAGATIWDSNGNQIQNLWSGKIYIDAGKQDYTSWTTSINTAGEYWLQFGIWNEAKTTLLAKTPSPSQNLIKVVEITISAQIVSYYPSNKITVYVNQKFTISVTFKNTGTSGANFYAGATIWDSSGNQVQNLWSDKIYVSAGFQGYASWTTSMDTAEEYWLQFGIWDETKSKLLDKGPSPSQNLIRVEPQQTGKPDLTVIGQVSFMPSSAVRGQSLSVQFTIKNTGSSPSGSFYVRISLATTEYGTDYSLGNFQIDSLSAGESRTVSQATNPIPSSVPTGSYYVTAFVDGFQQVDESDEYNNIGSSTPNKVEVRNQRPTCSLSANPRSGMAPLTVTFSMSASDPDGSISAWVLDVNGDGKADYSGYGNPPSTLEHTYTTEGSYSVVLMVSDNDGASAIATETVNVGKNIPPTCSLSPDKTSGEAPLTVTFTISASDQDGSISKWEFLISKDNTKISQDSGNGNPPSRRTYTFSDTGTYLVILKVYDNEGVTTASTCTIDVKAPTIKFDYIISVSGLGSSYSTNVYLNGVKKATLSNGQSYKFEGLSGSHIISVDSSISGGDGVRYYCSDYSTTASNQGTHTFQYLTQYYLTMQANPSDGGTVSPNSGWYDAGKQITISASPNTGYEFIEWSGSGSGSYSGSSQTVTIIMNGPITESANFQSKQTPPPQGVEELKKKIDAQLEAERGETLPPNLLDPKTYSWREKIGWGAIIVWKDFRDWITKGGDRYYDFYNAGVELHYISIDCLIKARRFVEKGDIDSAEKYLNKALRYHRASQVSFDGAWAVFTEDADETEMALKFIQKECEIISFVGLSSVNPAIAPTLEKVYTGVNFWVDWKTEGLSEAAKNAIISVVVDSIFNDVKISEADGRTIKQYLEESGRDVSFPLIRKAIKNDKDLEETILKLIGESTSKIAEGDVEELLNAIANEYIEYVRQEGTVHSPVELRVIDHEGRITGLVNGEVKQEIPMSFYCNNTIKIYLPTDSYHYEVVGMDEGGYGLSVAYVENGTINNFTVTDVPVATGTIHRYTIDWNALSQGREAATVEVDSDGDGVFERNFTSDGNLDRDEFTLGAIKFYAVWEDVSYPVLISSTSTISNFAFNQPQRQISFDLTGPSGLEGYCNLTIPKSLLKGEPWTVTVDGAPISSIQTENATYSFLYFTYKHGSTIHVTIQGTWVTPEFSSTILLPLFISTILIATILLKKKRS
jgi:PKD repeat protein